jgi:hypothetical protein
MKNLTVITLDSLNITDFAQARNKELAKAKTSWVLFLDTDETITPQLQAEIESTVRGDQYDAYYLKRQDIFLGRELKHGETGNAKFIRLAKKSFGKWVRPVHETWVGEGKVGTLNNPLIHHSHKNIASFLDKINRYSTLDAQYRYESGVKSSLWKIAIYPIAKFKTNYLLKRGFVDGVPGLIMAMMMSFHSYLTWTKLYLLWHKK